MIRLRTGWNKKTTRGLRTEKEHEGTSWEFQRLSQVLGKVPGRRKYWNPPEAKARNISGGPPKKRGISRLQIVKDSGSWMEIGIGKAQVLSH